MKILINLTLVAAFPLYASAQQTFKLAPSASAAGFSATRLQRIDSFYNAMIQRGDVPSAITFIAHNGQIVHNKAFGFSNLEKRTPAKTTDIFRIASQTKLVTTIAMMMLYEEGRFFLEDPVHKYLPEFKDVKVLVSFDKATGKLETRPPKSAPTIRQLLSHNAGIPYEMELDSLLVPKLTDFRSILGMNNEQVIKELAKRPLVDDPGTQFTYGYGIDIAGRIVEVLTGKSLNDFFQERIFRPLGIEDTYFYLPASKRSRLVELYSKERRDAPMALHKDSSVRNFALMQHKDLYLGGEGLVSTIGDYAKICQLILNGGEFNNVRLLSRKAVDMMMKNQIGDSELWERQDKYGFGFQVITDRSTYGDQASAGSVTWGGYYCSEYTIDPKEKLVMLIFTNIAPYVHYSEFVRKFRMLTYQALQ